MFVYENKDIYICADAVRTFMKTVLKMDENLVRNFRFAKCHRLKAQKYNTTRPIIVRFIEHSDRELIWKNVSEIPKNSYYFINEDYPKSIVFNRKKTVTCVCTCKEDYR